ncbi:MAG: Calx-beta domain-containing protein [Verrucomicrobiota bacterium]
MTVVPSRGQILYDFGDPTAEEQLYLEYINRARANPLAESILLANTKDLAVVQAYNYTPTPPNTGWIVDLKMMQDEFNPNNPNNPNLITAAPPLAPNAKLMGTSRGHSAWMLANATQTHNEGAVTYNKRFESAGYSSAFAGENISAYSYSVWFGHAGFEVDWGPDGNGQMHGGMQGPPRGHRMNIHNANYREIGVGCVTGRKTGSYGTVGPQLVTQDFGTQLSSPSFGTGVAYYDLNANNFYDVGEEISGLTVNVNGASYYCTTASGGGWVIPVPTDAATRTVNFTGLNMNQSVDITFPASTNAKADLKLTYSPPVITSPALASIDTLHTIDFNAIGGATSYNWNRWSAVAAAAENCDSTANITPSTTGGYSVLDTDVKQQGAAAFHLAIPDYTSQSFELNSLYYGNALATISFQSRIRYAITTEHFKVQVKEEGGTWIDVDDQTGLTGHEETGFTERTTRTLTEMVGKAFRIRFLQQYNGGSIYGTAYNMGWFIDAINFKNISTLTNNALTTLTTNTGSFTPAATGNFLMSVTPVISNRDYPASYQILSVSSPPVITSDPASISINSGSSTTLSVTASGTAPFTYQWYQGASGDTTTPVGTNSSRFTTPALIAETSYWVKVANAANLTGVNSSAATVTINQPAAIVTHPASEIINSGSTTTLSVTASGTAPFTYQWYQGASGTTTIPVGSNSASFTTSVLTTTTSYWVKVTNVANPTGAMSTTATVTVNQPAAITTSPASVSINTGTTTTLSVTASGTAPFTYQWYEGTSGTTTTPVGTDSASFTTPALTVATSYWVKVTNEFNPTGANSATATVTVNQPAEIVSQPASVTIDNGRTTTLSVTASGTAPFTYQWYKGTSGTTTTPVGTNSPSFTTPVLTATSSYWVRITNPLDPVGVDSNTATVTVNPITVSVTVASSGVLENGTSNLIYTFTRTGLVTSSLTASFSVGGSATLRTDYTQIGASSYTASAGTVIFAAGSSTRTITIDPVAETVVESDETVVLTVLAGTSYEPGSSSIATGTIINDDASVSVAVSPASVSEDGNDNLVYTFTRTGASSGALTAKFYIRGTATNITDYTQSGATSFSTTGTVIFAPGATTATVTLDPVSDTKVEANETAILAVMVGTGYLVGSPSSATGTITNDDATVSVAVSPASVTEDGAGNLVYTFTRSGATAGPLDVSFSVAGTAAFDTDYTQSGASSFSSTSGTVTFAPGATKAMVTLDPTADTAAEANETAILTIVPGAGYASISSISAKATGTINNDDTNISVAISTASVMEDGINNLVYTFTRTGNSTASITVNFSVGGTATFSSDYTQTGAASYTATTGTITLPARVTQKTVTLNPITDIIAETDETAVLTVVSGTGYTAVSPEVAIGTIANDDAPPP